MAINLLFIIKICRDVFVVPHLVELAQPVELIHPVIIWVITVAITVATLMV